jgi:anti-sigma factor RsiW
MACELWSQKFGSQKTGSEKLDAYLDGELSPAEERETREHLRTCPSCAADALDRMQIKRSIHAAGERFRPDAALRARVQKAAAAPKRTTRLWHWPTAFALSAAAIVLIAALSAAYIQKRDREGRLISELVDLHVAALASSNPVDVISTDRHTVKPWFEGKLPFTFDLPDLQNSPFTLIGGRTAYLNQSAGAELIFRIRQHNLSVFIFQERALGSNCAGVANASQLNFHLQGWSRNDLCYFVVGDVNQDDLAKLASLMKS